MLDSKKDGKKCTHCNEWKFNAQFSKRAASHDKMRHECKDCRKKAAQRETEQRRAKTNLVKGTILVIPDLQAPAHHKDSYAFLKAVKEKYQADTFVCIGDEMDFNWISKYEKCASNISASEEMKTGLEFLSDIYKLFPDCVVLSSNHVDVRYQAAMKSAAFLPDMVKDINDVLNMPAGWVRKRSHIIDEILFKHGHQDKKNLTTVVLKDIPKEHGRNYSLVVGHHHSEMGFGGLIHWRQHKAYWSCFTGCLMDKHHPFASYSRKYELLGCLIILDGWPRPVPMPVDENNRWTGELV